jgi:hypothetical protein
MNSYFTCISADSVITALVGNEAVAFAKDRHSVDMPSDVVLEIAAETLRLLLDGERLRNHRGEALAAYLGENDKMELRRILKRIGGSDHPSSPTAEWSLSASSP